ncbi:MAG: alpha/beta hydrolase [Polyangiaceae bacterium]|nr:alpha/beta hydrolase [Polyangiaceae bacterium]
MAFPLDVSWLFLAIATIGALFTLNVHWPLRRPAPLAVASFLAGWLTSELVGHTLLAQVGLAAACVALGALSDWPGWVGLGVDIVSWLFLAKCLESARAAEGVVDRALREGLGEDYSARIDPSVRDLPPLRFGWSQLLFPFFIRHPDVQRMRDIVYHEGNGLELHLDVYRQRRQLRDRPVLLQIHGGAWVVGNKNQQGLPLVTHLASRGWICVSANYRLSPRATFPDPLLDLKRVLAWIRENIAALGGDPNFVVVTGGSAGGHLASLVALTANDRTLQTGFEHVDTSVRACVTFYGVYDFTDRFGVWPHKGLMRLLETAVVKASFKLARERFEKASPIGHTHAQAPPFLVIHGDRDTLVPVAEARHFVEALRKTSKAPVVYAEVPGAQHAFEVFPSLRTALVVHGVERFLNTIYSTYLSDREGEQQLAALAELNVSAGARE